MILSLNVNDPNMMKYVEFIIPKRDLLAMFIFEVKQKPFLTKSLHFVFLHLKDTDDMELFIKECHEKQKLVVHGSAIPRMSLEEFRRESPSIKDLSKYGMFQYVLDTIQGPDPILRYLCQTIKLHTLPIANDSAMTQIDTITQDKRIRRFFVKNFFVCRNFVFVKNLEYVLLFSIHYQLHIIQMNHRQLMFMYKKKNI